MSDLERFVEAQDGPAGHARALSELRAGRKTSHWIWYVFPQLPMGRSSMAVRYAVAGVAEAEAYVRHETLRTRLVEVAEAAQAHLARGARLERLMGSGIDAQKLVSSMTLFERVAARLAGEVPGADRLAAVARGVLEHAAAQGVPRCPITVAALRAAYG